MTIEQEVAALTAAVNGLTEEVNVKKATLDQSVAAAENAATASAGSAGQSAAARDQSVAALGGIFQLPTRAGLDAGWMTHLSNEVSTVGSPGLTAVAAPLRVGAAGDYSRLTVYCHAGSAGEALRLALYKAADDGLPGEFVADFGEVALDTTGYKTGVLGAPVALDAGLYWVILQASSINPLFRGGYSAAAMMGIGFAGSSILQSPSFARIVYLGYADEWPADMTAFTYGTATNQIQLVQPFVPNSLLRS